MFLYLRINFKMSIICGGIALRMKQKITKSNEAMERSMKPRNFRGDFSIFTQ